MGFSDDGWSGFWREVDTTGRAREKCDFNKWTQTKWEEKGDPVGFERE
jgi:hypothetical protein